MASYSPGALEDLKKQMVHNAIKTTLQKEPTQWDGDAESGFHGASWEGHLPPVSGPTGTVRLKWFPPTLGFSAGMPPGATKSGEGTDGAGQSYIEYEVDPWASIYHPWIERIDQAFEGWDSIPDPADFDGPIAAVKNAVLALTALPTDDGNTGGDPNSDEFETKYTGVDLTSDLATMDKFLDPAYDGNGGNLVMAFYDNYGPPRIASVMGNQSQAAIVLGISLLATQKVWAGARTTIMRIAEKAVPSFKYGGSGGDEIDLEVVKAFADLVATFAPPQVKAVLATGTAALSLVEAVLPKKTEDKDTLQLEGYWPDEVYDSLVKAIRDLETSVFNHEYEIAYTTLAGLIGDMHSMKASDWHMHPDPGLAPQLESAPDLGVQVVNLKNIGFDLCTRIAAVFGHAAEDAQGANTPGIWARANQIGLGDQGAYPKWTELQGLFDDVTTGSGKELVEAGRRLAKGAGWIQDADDYAHTNLEGVNDDLDRGDLGFDNRVSTVPTGPGGMHGPY